MVTVSAVEIYLDKDQAERWGNLIFQYNDIGVVLPTTVENWSTRVNSVENFYQPSSYSVTVSFGENVVLKSPYYSHLPTIEINGESVKNISNERAARSNAEKYIS